MGHGLDFNSSTGEVIVTGLVTVGRVFFAVFSQEFQLYDFIVQLKTLAFQLLFEVGPVAFRGSAPRESTEYVEADISGLTTDLAGKAPTVHSHAISDVTGLQTALNGKASSTHTHVIADVTGLQTALNAKADTSSLATVATSGSYNDLTNKPTIQAIQRVRAQTDASGNYTWTYPNAYASGTIPVIGNTLEDGTANAITNIQITAISNTSVTVRVARSVPVLGILNFSTNPQVYVHLTAVTP